jgi:RNA polymerase sigma-70 factor (ECF subfamily)
MGVMLKPGRFIRRSDLRELADEELMQRARDGHAGAFGVLFDRHGGVAFSVAYRMCGRRAMAEDVVQEAFLALWRGAGRYDAGRGSVRSWLLSVVHNRAIDALRRGTIREGRRLDDERAAERVADHHSTEAEVVRLDEARRVRGALGLLPGEQRRVIELAYFGGYTHTEIAEMLELPVGTVKGRMRLGLSKMRLELDDAAGVVA